MNQVPNRPESDGDKVDSLIADKKAARRRVLLRLGKAALPVVATVASKPALAWHCQTTSAWGSELINPNTSLKATNSKEYTNETWTLTNWKANTTRAGVPSTKTPWASLFGKYPALRTASNGGADDEKCSKNVTVKMLVDYIPGFTNPGCSSTAKLRSTTNPSVIGMLDGGSQHQKATIVAQLNYVCLANPNSGWGMCVARPNEPGVPEALRQMASGSYSPPNLGVTWNQASIVRYLTENWIAVI